MGFSGMDGLQVDIHRVGLPEDGFLYSGQVCLQLIGGVLGLRVELRKLAREEVASCLLGQLLVEATVLLYLVLAKARLTGGFDYSVLDVGEGLPLIHLGEAIEGEGEQPVAFLVLGELLAKLGLLALSVDYLVENFPLFSWWRHLYSLLWACDVPALTDLHSLIGRSQANKKKGAASVFLLRDRGVP